MKRFALFALVVIVLAIGVSQWSLPVLAYNCTTAEYMNCDTLCHQYVPANCVITGTTCDSMGGSPSCGCDMFCTFVSYDQYSGGHKHMAIVPNEQ